MKSIIAQKIPPAGLSKRYNRANKFKVSRIKDSFGFHVYVLENTARREKINVRRFIFDRFRSVLKSIEKSWQRRELPPEAKVFYRAEVHFVIAQKLNEKQQYLIQELDHKGDTVGYMSFDIDAVAALNKLLYHHKLFHPNDLLNRLVEYHKIFRFSFSENTDSITSRLAIKTDLLFSLENYKKKPKPSFARKIIPFTGKAPPAPPAAIAAQAKQQNLFKSRLAEKAAAQPAAVNYEQLFEPEDKPAPQPEKVEKFNPQRMVLPLHALDVKNFTEVPFSCEFATDDFSNFLQFIGSDRHGEFLLGFEIIDCLFKQFGSLKTFKFPLYYMRVTLKESGKEIIIEPVEDGVFYLNHIALANLVEKFSKSKSADNLNKFFKTLLAQHVNIDDKPTRIYLSRMLPINEEIFEQVRKILFGAPEERGKGGILFDLTTVGVEIDLDSVMLYRTAKVQSLMAMSLEHDLHEILTMAYEHPQRFYHSNLGNFLSPETYVPVKGSFADRAWVPKALPKSFSALLKKLEEHNFLLIEGPPGTGKTHSILNLLIHSICTRKRVLVVSDQQSAIHALLEPLREFAYSGSRDTHNIANIIAQSIKVIDQIPATDAGLSGWATSLKKMLVNDRLIEHVVDSPPDYEAQLKQIDNDILLLKNKLAEKINQNLAPRNYHESTVKDIESILSFIRFCGYSRRGGKGRERCVWNRKIIREFMRLRLDLHKFGSLYRFFRFPGTLSEYNQELLMTREFIKRMLKLKPKDQRKLSMVFEKRLDNPVTAYFLKEWQRAFPPRRSGIARAWRYITALLRHPLTGRLKKIRKILNNQLALLQSADSKVIFQMNKIHHYLRESKDRVSCLAYEIFVKNETSPSKQKKKEGAATAQDILQMIEQRQEERDRIVKMRFLLNLTEIAGKAQQAAGNGQSDPLTTIAALCDSLGSYESLEMALPVLNDLKEKLLRVFPIWVCRKQAVSFLFPCVENSFDLVIVDEATQCRVDDALPLLFRASKLLVVGDDKQTVLAKNSALDDYLFKEFGLDEHLRKTQGQAFKGGGSHIFGLIKQIKQASLMLDEHYRCPPDIIAYSNRYVYHNDLKMMQWGSRDTVVVDYSEEHAETTTRQTRGVYKGIETDMVDRFLLFVEKTIKQIEAEEKIKINVEKNAALCYFLLKNEPYIKAKKGEFLQRLGRGNDILDGAGAALQGKERDYIFYLWDINRGNMMAFRQGDEEDKRKGELNVLMSRPKKRAYHYLHHGFAKLKHNSSTITDYLWKAYQQQQEVKERKTFVPRAKNPTPGFTPWRRYSGQLIEKILAENMKQGGLQTHYSVNIGDPAYCIDLVLETNKASIGIIDISRFMEESKPAEAMIDYYFQIKRAQPAIIPWFTFIRDIASYNDSELRVLAKAIERLK